MSNVDADMVDALDHIMRVANAARRQTRRDRWIANRAKCALEGGDWREVELPKMSGKTERETLMQAHIHRLEKQIQELTP